MSWLGRGVTSAGLVAERADLWLPGALGALAFFAWVPFVVAIVPWPSTADLAFFGAGLVGTGGLLRALVLSAAIFIALLAASGLAACAEAILLAWLTRSRPADSRPSIGSTAVSLFSIQQLCAVPAAAALLLAALVFASVAPAEFQAPDISGGLAHRIASAMAPYLVLLVAMVLLGQLVGGAATRHVAERGLPVGGALLAGVGDLARRPALIGVAVVTLTVHVAFLAFAYVLLRVLWAPIAPAFTPGQAAHPAAPLLLVGFMAIWFCLVLGAGAVHAWASAWWSVEQATGGAEASERRRRHQPTGPDH